MALIKSEGKKEEQGTLYRGLVYSSSDWILPIFYHELCEYVNSQILLAIDFEECEYVLIYPSHSSRSDTVALELGGV